MSDYAFIGDAKILDGSAIFSSLSIRDSAADNIYTIGTSNIASDVTASLPLLTASDAFVFENHSQILSNKTIIDASNVVTADNLRTLSGSESISTSTDPLFDQVLISDGAGTSHWDHKESRRSVRAATTSAGTLATDFDNGKTIDGVAVSTGDRILIKDQASPIENGIYIVQASGAPARSADFAAASAVSMARTFSQEGTTNASKGFICANSVGTDVVEIDPLTFTALSGFPRKIAYTLSYMQISVNSSSYTGVSFFPWDNSRYSTYSSGVLIAYVSISGARFANIRIYDVDNATPLGEVLSISASGVANIPITNPISDTIIRVDVSHNSGAGSPPDIFGLSLEFIQ
jgi:hypothetical protein